MKKYCIVLFYMIISFCTYAQEGYTSNDNYLGDWADQGTWTKSQPWLGNTPTSNVGGATSYINLYGRITHDGNLTLGGNSDLIVYDTLWVMGNLNVGSGSSLEIKNTGVLIVSGDLNASGGTLTSNTGRAVVLGNLSATGGANVNNTAAGTNGFYVFQSTTQGGGANFNGSTNPSSGNIKNESQLESENPDLFTLVNGGTLPVEFLYTKANKSTNGVSVSWATATELNNDFFTVERSKNGIDYFAFKTVQGAGNSTETIIYEVDDTNPFNGTNYYRVKQTDYDGKFEYSSITTFFNDAIVDFRLKMYPNPASDMLHMDLNRFGGEKVNIEIFDSKGNSVFQQVYFDLEKPISIRVETFPKGFYVVSMSNKLIKLTNKLLIKNN